jgi:hypothetical protein
MHCTTGQGIDQVLHKDKTSPVMYGSERQRYTTANNTNKLVGLHTRPIRQRWADNHTSRPVSWQCDAASSPPLPCWYHKDQEEQCENSPDKVWRSPSPCTFTVLMKTNRFTPAWAALPRQAFRTMEIYPAEFRNGSVAVSCIMWTAAR